jgi:hypothetical protein
VNIPGMDDPHDNNAIIAALRGESTSKHYMLKREAEETAAWCAIGGIMMGAVFGFLVGLLV